ncbi:oxidoreductase [Streptosporangium sp. NPDC051022]|uniref:oxidoreductase n=1 Tax=Streptosporangium sp. NPDC051022 TaxID=3155752 RepID=UPI0034131681
MTSTAKTIVISGGTDGMGRALASTYLGRGDTVVIIGRDAAKAAMLPRAHFTPANLSLVSENRRDLREINARHPSVDALALCARYFRSSRFVTAEGVEGVFGLEYHSRFLLSHGLDRPRVIVNVSGPAPGIPTGRIHWDDLMLERRYDGVAARMQAGRANNLLAVAFAARHSAGPNPLRADQPRPRLNQLCRRLRSSHCRPRHRAPDARRPVGEGIRPIIARLDDLTRHLLRDQEK